MLLGYWGILKLVLPTFINLLFGAFQGYTELYFMSRFGTLYTNGFGMAKLWNSIFGTFIISGLISGLDTLCCQAVGKGGISASGIYMNKARAFFSIIAIIMSSLTFVSDRVFGLLGVDDAICRVAKAILYTWLPENILNTHLAITRSFMNAHQVYYPQMYITSSLAIIHPLWCWLLSSKLGYIGIGFAVVTTKILNTIILTIYVYKSAQFQSSLAPLNSKSLHNWGYFIKTTLWGCLMTCIEWWASEFNSIIAAHINYVQLAAKFSLNSIYQIYSYMNSSLGICTVTLVGRSIGENSIQNAKYYYKLCIISNITFNLSASVVLLLVRTPFSYVFSVDPEVRSYICNSIVLLSIVSIIDSFECYHVKILVALGKQKIGFYLGIISYYCVMLPLSYLLSLKCGLGIYGLWISNGIGMGLLLAAYLVYIIKANWVSIADNCQMELNKEIQLSSNSINNDSNK